MKKGVIFFGILLLVLTIGLNGVLAAEEDEQVQKAYDCLQAAVDDSECDTLSIGEQIFSLLSLGECETELLDSADLNSDDEEECWPDGRCDIKTTAQTILALNENGVDTTVAEEWLLDQRMVPNELIWYLEIDSDEQVQCTVNYRGGTYDFEIGEDKVITAGALGNCLGFDSTFGPYWFQISDQCLEEEFEVTCNERFLTTLLYRQEDPKTIHVIGKIHSAPGEGTTREKIKSYCFEKSGECDYLGSLWATAVLDYLGEDVSEFIPYLITGIENNRNDFPEVFLYMLTTELEYKSGILEFQINNQYWRRGNNRFYDTALALLPFQNEALNEKENTVDWLLEIQQDDGCWAGGNIIDNGFLLYSIWPHLGPTLGGGDIIDDDNDTDYDNDCIESGYFCMSARNCEGDLLEEFDCQFPQKCCNKELVEKTCSELNGEICATNEFCSGGDTTYAAGLQTGEECCVEGICKVREDPTGTNECEDMGGTCEAFSCASGSEASEYYDCEYQGDTCCMPADKEGGSYWWIWALFVLVILTVVAIIYREKLKELYYKFKAKGGKGTGSQQPHRPGFPPGPGYNRRPVGPPPQRRIMPPQQRRPIQRPQKNPRELDDVLKKLKDMGK